MNLLPIALFFAGFCILVCKRTIVDLICGVQICFVGLLAYVALSGPSSLAIGFVVLLCAGLFGAVGISVLYKSGFIGGDKS